MQKIGHPEKWNKISFRKRQRCVVTIHRISSTDSPKSPCRPHLRLESLTFFQTHTQQPTEQEEKNPAHLNSPTSAKFAACIYHGSLGKPQIRQGPRSGTPSDRKNNLKSTELLRLNVLRRASGLATEREFAAAPPNRINALGSTVNLLRLHPLLMPAHRA